MRTTRGIIRRWFIRGQLTLTTPAHLSNGDPDPFVDLPILLDPLQGRALLTGASLTGALRHYVGAYTGSLNAGPSVDLFGGIRRDPQGEQSTIVVEDALGSQPVIELRDGVRIEPGTRTAADEAKYDRQVLAAGTTFDLGFEVVIAAGANLDSVRRALSVALTGLQGGDIRLGGRKSRGLGECRAGQWQIWDYDLRTSAGLRDWLVHEGPDWAPQTLPAWTGDDIGDWPEIAAIEEPDQRERFVMTTTLALAGSLLIRSGFETEHGPDVTHLESYRPEGARPVIAGTSLAGVLRAQALRIARSLDLRDAQQLVRNLFGYMPQERAETDPKQASRVTISEATIVGDFRSIVQNRVKIDRFTGGAADAALFAEQPVYGGEVTIRLEVQNPSEAEIGLLMLVLKDLWTGHLPVGGEASIGRGRFAGRSADMTWQRPSHPETPELTWRLDSPEQASDRLQVRGDPVDDLNRCLTQLHTLPKEATV